MVVGVSSERPTLSSDQGAASPRPVPLTSSTFRTRLKPLEWTPEEGKASTASPAAMRLPSITRDCSTEPTAKPARSYSPGL